jgi:hypothetical protein
MLSDYKIILNQMVETKRYSNVDLISLIRLLRSTLLYCLRFNHMIKYFNLVITQHIAYKAMRFYMREHCITQLVH